MIPPRFERAEGLTASERILAEIADQSFLKLWTYPNPYDLSEPLQGPRTLRPDRRVRRRCPVLGQGRRLSLHRRRSPRLEPFLSLRDHRVGPTAPHRQELETAISDHVFLDVRCQTPLPVALPPVARLRVHRICVAPAATEAARDRGGQTGLAIVPAVAADERPYAVGLITGCQGWVHVFDEDTMATVLPNLSTAPDFTAYLRAKEALIAAGGLEPAASEKDLLAVYLTNERSFPEIGLPLW